MGIRIIGGNNRGRRLLSVKGMSTRPTADRMRETLFNIIRNRIQGAHVLDLFAGTGALGLEALSRGAEDAVFIDRHPEAITVIRKNIDACRQQKKAQVIRWDIVGSLKCLQNKGPSFNLVFMDPPYQAGCVLPTLQNLQTCGRLGHDTLVIVEHSYDQLPPDDVGLLQRVEQRKYGKTWFSFFHVTSIAEKEIK